MKIKYVFKGKNYAGEYKDWSKLCTISIMQFAKFEQSRPQKPINIGF